MAKLERRNIIVYTLLLCSCIQALPQKDQTWQNNRCDENYVDREKIYLHAINAKGYFDGLYDSNNKPTRNTDSAVNGAEVIVSEADTNEYVQNKDNNLTPLEVKYDNKNNYFEAFLPNCWSSGETKISELGKDKDKTVINGIPNILGFETNNKINNQYIGEYKNEFDEKDKGVEFNTKTLAGHEGLNYYVDNNCLSDIYKAIGESEIEHSYKNNEIDNDDSVNYYFAKDNYLNNDIKNTADISSILNLNDNLQITPPYGTYIPGNHLENVNYNYLINIPKVKDSDHISIISSPYKDNHIYEVNSDYNSYKAEEATSASKLVLPNVVNIPETNNSGNVSGEINTKSYLPEVNDVVYAITLDHSHPVDVQLLKPVHEVSSFDINIQKDFNAFNEKQTNFIANNEFKYYDGTENVYAQSFQENLNNVNKHLEAFGNPSNMLSSGTESIGTYNENSKSESYIYDYGYHDFGATSINNLHSEIMRNKFLDIEDESDTANKNINNNIPICKELAYTISNIDNAKIFNEDIPQTYDVNNNYDMYCKPLNTLPDYTCLYASSKSAIKLNEATNPMYDQYLSEISNCGTANADVEFDTFKPSRLSAFLQPLSKQILRNDPPFIDQPPNCYEDVDITVPNNENNKFPMRDHNIQGSDKTKPCINYFYYKLQQPDLCMNTFENIYEIPMQKFKKVDNPIYLKEFHNSFLNYENCHPATKLNQLKNTGSGANALFGTPNLEENDNQLYYSDSYDGTRSSQASNIDVYNKYYNIQNCDIPDNFVLDTSNINFVPSNNQHGERNYEDNNSINGNTELESCQNNNLDKPSPINQNCYNKYFDVPNIQNNIKPTADAEHCDVLVQNSHFRPKSNELNDVPGTNELANAERKDNQSNQLNNYLKGNTESMFEWNTYDAILQEPDTSNKTKNLVDLTKYYVEDGKYNIFKMPQIWNADKLVNKNYESFNGIVPNLDNPNNAFIENHPIIQGMDNIQLTNEMYYNTPKLGEYVNDLQKNKNYQFFREGTILDNDNYYNTANLIPSMSGASINKNLNNESPYLSDDLHLVSHKSDSIFYEPELIKLDSINNKYYYLFDLYQPNNESKSNRKNKLDLETSRLTEVIKQSISQIEPVNSMEETMENAIGPKNRFHPLNLIEHKHVNPEISEQCNYIPQEINKYQDNVINTQDMPRDFKLASNKEKPTLEESSKEFNNEYDNINNKKHDNTALLLNNKYYTQEIDGIGNKRTDIANLYPQLYETEKPQVTTKEIYQYQIPFVISDNPKLETYPLTRIPNLVKFNNIQPNINDNFYYIPQLEQTDKTENYIQNNFNMPQTSTKPVKKYGNFNIDYVHINNEDIVLSELDNLNINLKTNTKFINPELAEYGNFPDVAYQYMPNFVENSNTIGKLKQDRKVDMTPLFENANTIDDTFVHSQYFKEPISGIRLKLEPIYQNLFDLEGNNRFLGRNSFKSPHSNTTINSYRPCNYLKETEYLDVPEYKSSNDLETVHDSNTDHNFYLYDPFGDIQNTLNTEMTDNINFIKQIHIPIDSRNNNLHAQNNIKFENKDVGSNNDKYIQTIANNNFNNIDKVSIPFELGDRIKDCGNIYSINDNYPTTLAFNNIDMGTNYYGLSLPWNQVQSYLPESEFKLENSSNVDLEDKNIVKCPNEHEYNIKPESQLELYTLQTMNPFLQPKTKNVYLYYAKISNIFNQITTNETNVEYQKVNNPYLKPLLSSFLPKHQFKLEKYPTDSSQRNFNNNIPEFKNNNIDNIYGNKPEISIVEPVESQIEFPCVMKYYARPESYVNQENMIAVKSPRIQNNPELNEVHRNLNEQYSNKPHEKRENMPPSTNDDYFKESNPDIKILFPDTKWIKKPEIYNVPYQNYTYFNGYEEPILANDCLEHEPLINPLQNSGSTLPRIYTFPVLDSKFSIGSGFGNIGFSSLEPDPYSKALFPNLAFVNEASVDQANVIPIPKSQNLNSITSTFSVPARSFDQPSSYETIWSSIPLSQDSVYSSSINLPPEDPISHRFINQGNSKPKAQNMLSYAMSHFLAPTIHTEASAYQSNLIPVSIQDSFPVKLPVTSVSSTSQTIPCLGTQYNLNTVLYHSANQPITPSKYPIETNIKNTWYQGPKLQILESSNPGFRSPSNPYKTWALNSPKESFDSTSKLLKYPSNYTSFVPKPQYLNFFDEYLNMPHIYEQHSPGLNNQLNLISMPESEGLFWNELQSSSLNGNKTNKTNEDMYLPLNVNYNTPISQDNTANNINECKANVNPYYSINENILNFNESPRKSERLPNMFHNLLKNTILNNINLASDKPASIYLGRLITNPSGETVINFKVKEPDLDLYGWYSKIKMVKATLILENEDSDILNFRPILKSNIDPIEAQNRVVNLLQEYGRPVMVNENDNNYFLEDVNGLNLNETFYLLWPPYCNY